MLDVVVGGRRPLTLPELARVSELLDESLDMPAENREAWLAALESREPQLASVVRVAFAGQDSGQELLARRDLVLQQLASEDSADPGGEGFETEIERLAIGAILSGRYRIERELGEGGMGVVYLASDEQVAGEQFAIKVLKGDSSPERLNLLREEVHKARRLSHPNIVDVHSVNVDGTRLYVLMEYLEGRSLKGLLDEEFARGVPLSRAWPIIEDVAAALGYAHDHSVIHSDLKPANIFVTTAGRTKLLDFGIARISRGRGLRKKPGHLALTPAYASCEMLEEKDPDRRDDIYSFACVIYEMLCGEHPFGERTALEAREAGATVRPLMVLSRRQNAALSQALSLDRERRTASVEKLLEGFAGHKIPRTGQLALAAVASVLGVTALGLAYLALEKRLTTAQPLVAQPMSPGGERSVSPAATSPTAAPFNPPPHSIAVLPFLNLSGDEKQEYFSDGLAEELLNSLTQIPELQVAARTSAFSFKGKDTDVGTIGRKLNVGVVLEGSVRRSGSTLRITTQLINAVTGFHLWSHTYDRPVGDVLKLQTEIAGAVASALKVSLLGDEVTKIELGGTHNPEAFDAYLRGQKAYLSQHGRKDYQTAVAAYTEAIGFDPNYALAFAGRSLAVNRLVSGAPESEVREDFEKSLSDAQRAIAIAPDLADGHMALAAAVGLGALDLTRATEEYARALALAPGNANVLRTYGYNAVLMGHSEAGIAAIRRAVMLDPLSLGAHLNLGTALRYGHQYREAVAAFQDALALDPESPSAYAGRGLTYYALGDFEHARTSCETKPEFLHSQVCLAITYNKLGRHADAESALRKLKDEGDAQAFQYAAIYAQWGNTPKALEWLEKAMQLRDPGLAWLRADPLLDPLRSEPRFQAVERAVRFPESS
jgi:serine/threonine protein kinase/cytochrome c-type biogenesis protein CcmH/NrfG